MCLLLTYGFSEGYAGITLRGFPHSDIPGSMPAYGSPRRFVVRHVLLRLLAPRHPPCALICLSRLFPLIPTTSNDYRKIANLRKGMQLQSKISITASRSAYSLTCLNSFCFRYPVFKERGNLSYLIRFRFATRKFCLACRSLQAYSVRKMVDPSGIEPLTSCLQGRRSPS